MTLIRRAGPWDDLFTLRRTIERLFDDERDRGSGARRSPAPSRPWTSPRTADELVVKASLAGWKPEDVEITLTGNTLTISGEMKEEERRERGLLDPQRDPAGQLQPHARAARWPRRRARHRRVRAWRADAPDPEGRGDQAEADQDLGRDGRHPARARARRSGQPPLSGSRPCSAAGSIGTPLARSTSSPWRPGSSRSIRGRSGSTRTRA